LKTFTGENGLHPLTDQRARAPHMRVKLLLQEDDDSIKLCWF